MPRSRYVKVASNCFRDGSKGENVISAYFNGPREQPTSPIQYERSIATYYAEHMRYLVPLPAAKDPAYNLRAATPPNLPDHAPSVASGLADAELLVQQSINTLAVVGALVFALRRRSDPLTRMIGTVGIASLFVLAASRLSGTLAADYNSSRLFLQCLFILALLEAALLEMVVTRLKSRSWVGLTVFGGFSLVLLVAFVGNSGLDAPVTGGNPPLILYNKGQDYAAFYPERAGKGDSTVVGRRSATPAGDLRGRLRAASVGPVHESSHCGVQRCHAPHDRPKRLDLRLDEPTSSII